MARITNGMMGAFSGTIGNVVGTTWKGIPLIRSKPHYRNDKRTFSDAQAATRLRFAVATRFLRNMRELLELGFKDHAKQMTGTNSAISYIMKHAITGDFPDFKIAYNKVLLCLGYLPNGDNPTATAAPGEKGAIQFNWTTNELTGKASGKDQVLMIAYDAEHNAVIYKKGTERHTYTSILPVTDFSGRPLHTWISFVSADGQDVATSIYTGLVVAG
jgi:hypothetical protein